ncbi:MAG: (d)CMP kinase [Lachnospiraceae bacterium]|nr:(d)CMP kinase [Lachnospiraceae bacterium]
MGFNVALDGPAGAGKSTVAKAIAKEMNLIHVDTGAMYRALAYFFITNDIPVGDEKAVSEKVKNATVTLDFVDGAQKVTLNGTDVTAHLREEAVGNAASVTSAYPAVRAHLLELQRVLAKEKDVIMDGRDIGTAILPDANAKIYLTASSDERANRRVKELIEKGEKADFEKIKADIEDRDYRDMHRETAPLKQAEDAYFLDSSNMTIDEVVKTACDFIRSKK